MYASAILKRGGVDFMAGAPKRTRKRFQLDTGKLKRAQRVLQAKTETEAIERALDLVIAEQVKDRRALNATERFLKVGSRFETYTEHWTAKCRTSNRWLE
jgi:hypothetical protein